MEKVYEAINKEIAKFNLSYDEDSATESQKAYTKQFEGLNHINTSKTNAQRSWEFSKAIETILEITEKGMEIFEILPDGAILRNDPLYKMKKADGLKPIKAFVGFKTRLTFNDLRKLFHQDFSAVCETVFYFEA